MEASQKSKSLGEEKISRLLLRFAVPCVAGLLISAFYNIVDQIFIGNSELGYLGNAATGISFPVLCIANAFAWCIGDGAAAYLSICSGRKDAQSAHKCVGTGLTMTLLISLVLMAVCEIFCRPLMLLFGASAQTVDLAVNYFTIIAAAFPVYLPVNVMNSMIRADGSPAYAMAAMLAGAVTNIVLDPIFIFWLHWGIEGAAWATVIGQMLSFLVCAVYFFRPKSFRLSARSFVPDGRILCRTAALGASVFITQISIVVISLTSNIVLARYGAMSVYGQDIPLSVFSIETKVYSLVTYTVVGIVLGSQPIFGYNYGAHRFDRVRETYRIVLKATLAVGLISTLLFELCPHLLVRIFGTADGLYLDFAVRTFRIFLMFTIATCFIKMSAIFFQSIGKPLFAVASSLVRDILCFTPLAILLPALLEKKEAGTGIYGILYAAPIADVIAGSVILCLTLSFFRSLKKQENAPALAPEAAEESVLRASRPGVIVTIAREHGTGGKQIGMLAAKQLGIPFYCKELTAMAAHECGLDRKFLEELGESTPRAVRDLYLSTNVMQEAVAAQEEIIRRIAQNGACVIVGRAADHVLRGHDRVLRVFIHAPFEQRVANVMEMYGDTREEAAAHIRRADAARAAYYQDISGSTWGDAHQYDLCIDASAGREACADAICRLAAALKA